VPYKDWPPFFGTMEHFDPEGSLVTPHMHFLFRLEEPLEKVAHIVKRLWSSAVEDAGETGVDLQIISENDIGNRVGYILKDTHQDGMEQLQNGACPHKLCERYQWPSDALAHDKCDLIVRISI